MEDGLSQRQTSRTKKRRQRCVLILVLVEDGLRVEEARSCGEYLFVVLILVLVEDGLRDYA